MIMAALQKLALAGMTEENAVAKAARTLLLEEHQHSTTRDRHGRKSALYQGSAVSSLYATGKSLNAKHAKRLREVAGWTTPKRGTVKQRREEVRAEITRQCTIRLKRFNRLNEHRDDFHGCDDETMNGFGCHSPYKAENKQRLLDTFLQRRGIMTYRQAGVTRYKGRLIFWSGSNGDYAYAYRNAEGNYETVRPVKPWGSETVAWEVRCTTVAGFIGAAHLVFADGEDELFARAALAGASISIDLFEKQTTVLFPSGECQVRDWKTRQFLSKRHPVSGKWECSEVVKSAPPQLAEAAK